MNEETKILIKLINKNKSLQEITEIMNISKRQLFQKMTMLRQSGYLIDKNYYYNGDIKYSLENPFTQKEPNKLTIQTPNELDKIRIVATSDSHYGNTKENSICRDKMFEYCTKEGINLIFHLGDIFEGVNPNSWNKQKYNSVQEQIQKVISGYPLVDNILTIAILGNHDATFWLNAGIDIKTVLESKRHDIVPIGYEQGEVIINGVDFILLHPIDKLKNNSKITKKGIYFNGHSHRFKIVNNQNKLNIFVPSSSNMDNDNKGIFFGNGVPSIIDAEFIIKQKIVSTVIINHYILYNDSLIKVGEFVENVQISRKKNTEKEKKLSKPALYTCFSVIEQMNGQNLENFNIESENNMKNKNIRCKKL